MINLKHNLKTSRHAHNASSQLISNSLLMRKQSMGNMTLQESIHVSPEVIQKKAE